MASTQLFQLSTETLRYREKSLKEDVGKSHKLKVPDAGDEPAQKNAFFMRSTKQQIYKKQIGHNVCCDLSLFLILPVKPVC